MAIEKIETDEDVNDARDRLQALDGIVVRGVEEFTAVKEMLRRDRAERADLINLLCDRLKAAL